jgi:membrane fusion protein (multidrug efflux system)
MRPIPHLPLFVSILLSGITACEKSAPNPNTGPAEVLVTPAVARDVSLTYEWIGTLDGSENADIRARVTGYLTKRNYQEGGFVKMGEVLFEIDPRPFEAALAEA